VLWVGIYAPNTISPIDLLLSTLMFTLVATAITLIVLNKLLQPVTLAKQILLNYQQHQIIPNLDIKFQDEVGIYFNP
jgi:hypothetical protein